MNSTIFLPKKIKVGFNKRQDTYTGMLGFVIPHDGKKEIVTLKLKWKKK